MTTWKLRMVCWLLRVTGYDVVLAGLIQHAVDARLAMLVRPHPPMPTAVVPADDRVTKEAVAFMLWEDAVYDRQQRRYTVVNGRAVREQ